MSKHALRRPTDLRAPGAIEQLLVFHRQHFGDARMAADGDGVGGDAGDTSTDGGETKTADADTKSDTAKTDDAKTTDAGEGKVEDLPEWAQKLVRDARADAGKARTTAKQQAADEARQQLAQDIGKALGLVKTDKDKPNPDELAKQVTDAQNAARVTAVELAVYKTASKHSGDPDALLDSRAFLAKVANLDPTANDFASKVDGAIKSAVADNPKLKAARAAGASGADHAGGSGEGAAKPTTLEDAIAQKMAQ
ncbi:hypothetical protein [Terrabacter sp. NPDC000476]|uniref:hypothetical protein n=1 Tax=Terrabacter sp. NPDC000476 TaxID=3154258 RepID=UPI003316F519